MSRNTTLITALISAGSSSSIEKFLFLLDWSYAINNGHQLSSFRWHLGLNGPVLSLDGYRSVGEELIAELLSEASSRPQLGQIDNGDSRLSSKESEYVRNVQRVLLEISPLDLNRIISSTFPMLTGEPFQELDLGMLANSYSQNLKDVQLPV